MKNFLIVALSCVVAALAFGIKPVQEAVNRAINGGTLTGVETCMRYSESPLLSKEAIRNMCVDAFQTLLFSHEHADGKAGPRFAGQTVSWGGILENKSPNHVTTWVRISVIIFDEDGTELETVGESQVWIDPLGKAEFGIELPDLKPEQFEKVEFCELDDTAPKSCFTWGLVEIKGLRL